MQSIGDQADCLLMFSRTFYSHTFCASRTKCKKTQVYIKQTRPHDSFASLRLSCSASRPDQAVLFLSLISHH